MPLLERVRIEDYLPESERPEYDNLLQSLTKEFTYPFGGCSVVRGIEGSYLSSIGNRIPDRINLDYFDAPLALSIDFTLVAAYSRELKAVVIEALTEEDVLISVKQVYHAV